MGCSLSCHLNGQEGILEEEEENHVPGAVGLPKNNSSHSSSDDMRVERLRRSADIGPAVAVYQKGLESFEAKDYHQATLSFQSALEILQGIDGDALSPSCSSSGSVGGDGSFPEGPPQRPAHTTTRRTTTRARARKRYPLEIAMCYNNLGQISKRLGNLQDALLQYHEARFVLVSMGSALDGPMRSLLGETYNNIGCTNHEQGNLEEALIYYTQARKTDQEQEELLHEQQQQQSQSPQDQQHPHEDEDEDEDESTSTRSKRSRRHRRQQRQRPSKNLAITFNNIASVYRDMGKTQEASLYFGKAVVVMDQVLASSTSTLSLVTGGGGADLAIARMYQNHADLLQPEQALVYYEKAWYSVQNDDDDDDDNDENPEYDYSDTDEETKTFLALLSNKLATAYHHSGNLEKAFRYYQKAKSLLSSSSSSTKSRENSQQLALAMHNSAVVLYLLSGGSGGAGGSSSSSSSDDDNNNNNSVAKHRLQEAWEYGVRAKELWSSSSTLVLAETHNCLAAILLQQRFLDKARVAVVSSRRLLESNATPPHHPTVLNATYLWGEICMETGQHEGALEAAQSVLQLQEPQTTTPENNNNNNNNNKNPPIGWLVQRWAQHIRARIQTRQGRYDQALSIYDDCLCKNPHDAESHFYKLQTRVLLLIELEKQWIRQKQQQQQQQQQTTTTSGRLVVAHQEINRELGSCSVQLKTAIQALETEYGRQSPSGQQQQQQSEKTGKESQTSNHSNLFVLSLPESNRLDGEAVVQKLKHLRARYSLFQTASARTLQVPKEDDGNGEPEGDSNSAKEAETSNNNNSGGQGSSQETTEWGDDDDDDDDNNATEEDHSGGGGWLDRRGYHHHWHDMFASTLAEGPKEWQETLLEHCRLDNTREYMESVAMELKNKLMSMHGLKGSLETTDRQMTATLTVALSAVGLVALAGGDDNHNNKDSPTSVAATTTRKTTPQWDPSILERWHRLSFYDLADFVSASQEEEVDVLLQRVVLDWVREHHELVRSLPRPETAFGASVRKSLFLGMRHVCHHMSSETGSWTYRVNTGCKALFDAVALKQRRKGTNLKRRKPIPLVRNPASNPDCLPHDKLLHQRAMEYTFGGDNRHGVTLESVQTQWFTAKPTSPAAVLGKVHSHMILELLLRREVKDILLGGDTRRNIRDDTRVQRAFETMTLLKNQHVVSVKDDDDDDEDDGDGDATTSEAPSLSNAPSPPSPTHQLQHLVAAKIQPVHG